MKILYLDLGMGAAGDMLAAALLELFPEEERQDIVERLNALGIPDVRFEAERSVKCGITGTHLAVRVGDTEEDEHLHEHTHADGHVHTHNSLHGIEHIVNDHMQLSEKIRADVMAVYGLIAEAESHVHGVPVSEIHFHEVGTMDAVADITAVSLLLDLLSPDRIVASAVNTGGGRVRCAHGILPVPAPATAYIIQGMPTYDSGIKGELLTPTGAALIRHFAAEFGSRPPMRIGRIGYGMGKKDFENANCVRAMLGEELAETVVPIADRSEKPASDGLTADTEYYDSVSELAVNLDDMTAEEIGFAFGRIMEAGALDVWMESALMKKNRPGVILHVLCRETDRDELVRTIFRYTSTIGIREYRPERYTLKREIVSKETPYGMVRTKQVTGYGVARKKFEYEDLAAIAAQQGISIAEARRLAAHS